MKKNRRRSRKRKHLILVLLIILLCIIVIGNIVSRFLIKKIVSRFAEDAYYSNMEDSTNTNSDIDSNIGVGKSNASLKDVEFIEEHLTDNEKQCLSMYFNEGYKIAINEVYSDGNTPKIYLYYENLIWDTGIETHTRYPDTGLSVTVIDENAYIFQIAPDEQKMYKFNLNTYDYECVLNEEDFEPYLYVSGGNTWLTRIFKSDTKIYIFGKAEDWVNAIEYDLQNPSQGLIYKGKLTDETGDIWDFDNPGYFNFFETNQRIFSETPGEYIIVNGYGNYESYTLIPDSCVVTNYKIYDTDVEGMQDIFIGKIDGSLYKFTMDYIETADEITGENTRSCILSKTNLDNDLKENLFEIPLLKTFGNGTNNEATFSRFTGNKIIFRASKENGYDTGLYVIDLNEQNIKVKYQLTELYRSGLNGAIQSDRSFEKYENFDDYIGE